MTTTNERDRELAATFDDWRAGLPENERIIVDDNLDRLITFFDNKRKPLGPQSAKVILAHTIARCKPIMQNEREK